MVFYRGHPTRTVCVAVYPPRSDIDTLTGRRTCNGHDCAGQQRWKRKTPCSAQSTVVEEGIFGLLEERSFSALRQRRPCLSNAGREDCVRQVGAKVFPCLPLLRSGVRYGDTVGYARYLRSTTTLSTYSVSGVQEPNSNNASRAQSGAARQHVRIRSAAVGRGYPSLLQQARVTPRCDWVRGALCCVGIPRSGGACTCHARA